MRMRASYAVLRLLLFALAGAGLLASGMGSPGAYAAGYAPRAGSLSAAFAAASARHGVPEALLLAVGYAQTRWDAGYAHPEETRDGGVAADGAGSYGIMALYQTHAGAGTLPQAASALGGGVAAVKADPAANIAGAAAILADGARATNGGRFPAGLDGWYGALARFAGMDYPQVAHGFADQVYALLASGVRDTASTGEALAIPAQAVHPDTSRFPAPPAARPRLAPGAYPGDDAYIPAAPTAYAPADRPGGGLFVQFIIIHDTEVGYPGTVHTFADSGACCSAHFVVDGEAGSAYPTVTQFVAGHDISYQAGNWWYNQHAIGIEHVGFADRPGGYYTRKLYDASARLVAWLCMTYHIPIDRAHILGHGNVPAYTAARSHTMHWDPGPFWDWAYYLNRVSAAYAQLAHNAARPAGVAPLRTSTATNARIRRVAVNGSHSGAASIPSWTNGTYQDFANVFADAAGKPSSALALGASDPSTWVGPSNYNARDFSCDTLPSATSSGGHWTEDTNSDHRAKAEFGEEVAVQAQRWRGGVLYDKISFNGATGWVRHAVTLAGAGRIVRFIGGATPTTLYGAPIADPFNAICPDAANGFSRAGQVYASGVQLMSGGAVAWYEIFYNHRVAWVPAGEVRPA